MLMGSTRARGASPRHGAAPAARGCGRLADVLEPAAERGGGRRRRGAAGAAACAMVRAPCADMIRFQILLGDASARAGAFHLAQVDVVLARHLAHQRRKRTGGFRSAAPQAVAPAGTAPEPAAGGAALRAAERRLSCGRRSGGAAAAAAGGGAAAPLPPPSSILPTTVLIADRLAFLHQNFAPACRPPATESRCPLCRSRSRTAARRAPRARRASSATWSAFLRQCFRPSGA